MTPLWSPTFYECLYVGLVCFLGFGVLVAWETRVFRRRQEEDTDERLPSEYIGEIMAMFRRWSYHVGRWLSCYFNPLYYIRKLWPHLKLYFDSATRLLKSLVPPVMPGWDFLRGFFSNPLYGYTTALGGVAFLMWRYAATIEDSLRAVPEPVWVGLFFFSAVCVVIIHECLKDEDRRKQRKRKAPVVRQIRRRNAVRRRTPVVETEEMDDDVEVIQGNEVETDSN